MIDAGADLLVVTCELDFAVPALDRAADAGVLVISPCGAEAEWGDGTAGALAFSMVAPWRSYGAAMADLLWSEGDRVAAVIWDESTPEPRGECSGFVDRWDALGATATLTLGVGLAGAAGIADSTDRRNALGADVVVVCGGQRVGTRLLQAIRSAGVTTPIVAGPSLDSADFRPADVPELGDLRMVTFAAYGGDDPAPRVQDAASQFRQADGIPPATGRFVLGADLAALWFTAVEMAGTTDGAAVAATIESLATVDAVSGPLAIDDHAVGHRVLRVLRHEEGAMVFDRLWGDD
jgi:branched-chain amino acid transport system substrate-binding protein